MNRLILIICIAFGLIASILNYPDGLIAMGAVAIITLLAIAGLQRIDSFDSNFLINIFLIALLPRLVFGFFVHFYDLREFFGGDALTYDFNGNYIAEIWKGNIVSGNDWLSRRATQMSGSGWGMNYLTGIIYLILGKNIYAAQSVCAVIGAITAPFAYICSYKIFTNKRVSTISAFLVALFPAFIIWSGQLLKDGLIVFLLVIAMIAIIQLQEKFSYIPILILLLALGGILSLRFYIFFMIIVAVVGAFLIGQTSSSKSILQRVAVLIILGLGLTYLGVIRNASSELDTYGSLERLQNSRKDLANSADSGFGGDVDISTTEGALSTIPLGLTYLMLAPFPWQMTSLRSVLSLPETLVWWALIPFMVSGIVYSVKSKLRKALPVLIFTLMLTLAYSVFQGNVGTAYRQRTQIQVFLFMFIAVGWTISREKRENQEIINRNKRLKGR